MKTVLTSGYAFTASAKTLDFTGTTGFDVKRLYAVINVTRGVLVYAVGTAGLGYSALNGNVLTLTFDTTAHANTDALMVLYEGASSTVVEAPFQPISGKTVSVTAGPVATAAGALPLAAAGVIPVGMATSYRVRNAASSASPITWILTTDPTKTPTIPTPASQAGTGGVAGDKTIDPGGVEVITLSAAQQTALAAGTLYLSAVTPAGGSGVLAITPGIGG